MLCSRILRLHLKQPCIRHLHQMGTGASPSSIAPVSFGTTQDLCNLFRHMNLQQKPAVYKLPTTEHTAPKTILDPWRLNVSYELPALSNGGLEKFSPGLLHIVPIEDPSPLQKVIDQGGSLEKQAMPWLMRVRHKKMKKHKLKKFRKRNIFLHRKLSQAKRQKKEAVMVAFERKMAVYAEEFDAEKYVAARIEKAKRGGWGIDVIETWKQNKTTDL